MPPSPITVVHKVQALQWDGTNTSAVLDFANAYPPFADSNIEWTAEAGEDGLVLSTPLELLSDMVIPEGGYLLLEGTGRAIAAEDLAAHYHTF